ncbi:translation elongation factor 4 [Patescibacteria group bacterium]|nr:translation elongation factor 4 [Patescibacteria group bacterium]MBU1931087.1 translation elongation factor 4 [Patescibacteria group bacterium]
MITQTLRNFAIISHIDHGKSTLADRLLELTGTILAKDHSRLLDSHPIEQERGITIKLAPVRMNYTLRSTTYTLNLIDTPGHVDFSYEVSRSLKACEGAILLVDAQTGIQAQTMANAQLALDNKLKIIPVVNKIDLVGAEPEKAARDLGKTFGFRPEEILFISAKTGENIEQLMEAIVLRIPPPSGDKQKPLKALVFNSFYHSHKGVVAFVRLVDGQINLTHQRPRLVLVGTKAEFAPLEIGVFEPGLSARSSLSAGEVGYVATGLKQMSLCQVGDTLTALEDFEAGTIKPLVGYQPAKPMVFLDFYPTDNQDFPFLKEALAKLQLIDASLSFKPVNSPTLGAGFRLGFLGILHAEIVQERLERDYNLDVVATAPSVEYRVKLVDTDELLTIQHPAELPEQSKIAQILEPIVTATIFTPLEYLGNIMQLCQENRGQLINQDYFGEKVKLIYYLPLVQLLSGFYNQLKSLSSGFASLDWQLYDYQAFKAARVKVLLNRESVESLVFLTPHDRAYAFARNLAQRLKQVIPRQQYEVIIQVAIGEKIIARERVAPFRKDVTAKLYGGDQTRKDKLLKKQKKGKKRLKAFGRITLSQEALQAVLANE